MAENIAENETSTRTDTHQDDSKLMTASENVARVLGVLFIVIGAGLIIALIIGFVVSRLPYRVDPNLPIPTLDNLEKSTNKDTITITGTALPGEDAILFRDGERMKDTADTDEEGDFEFSDVVLEEEGEVTFEAGVVRGGVFKRRSEYSNQVSTYVDWTPPSSVVSVEYEKSVAMDTTTIKGTAEANATIIFESEANTKEIVVSEDGTFEITNLPVGEGTTIYTIRIKDSAGNEVVASEKVEIAYAGDGDVNGNGAATGPNGEQLPESAGELEAALEFLKGNKIMLTFGILALAIFGVSSTTAYKHSKRNG